MNKNIYNEIINGEDTYKEIAAKFKKGRNVIIGWTDEEMTHYDILFTAGAYKEEVNQLQRGIKAQDLFVSIIGKNAFGFKITEIRKHPDYIGEKLDIKYKPTLNKITDLINGVIEKILEV